MIVGEPAPSTGRISSARGGELRCVSGVNEFRFSSGLTAELLVPPAAVGLAVAALSGEGLSGDVRALRLLAIPLS